MSDEEHPYSKKSLLSKVPPAWEEFQAAWPEDVAKLRALDEARDAADRAIVEHLDAMWRRFDGIRRPLDHAATMCGYFEPVMWETLSMAGVFNELRAAFVAPPKAVSFVDVLVGRFDKFKAIWDRKLSVLGKRACYRCHQEIPADQKACCGVSQ